MKRLILITIAIAGCESTGRKESALTTSEMLPRYVEVYNLQGDASTVDKRRLHAYSRIKERCTPDAFQIIGETRYDPTLPREQPMGTAETQNLAYVEYSCFPKK